LIDSQLFINIQYIINGWEFAKKRQGANLLANGFCRGFANRFKLAMRISGLAFNEVAILI